MIEYIDCVKENAVRGAKNVSKGSVSKIKSVEC